MDLATLRIAVDSRQVKTANQDLDALGKKASQAEGKTDSLGTKGTQTFNGLAAAARVAGAAYAALASARAFIQIADEYTKINGQLRIATNNQAEFNTALNDVKRIANQAQAEISTISALYARLNLSLRENGASMTQVAQITETVALALKAAGAGVNETSSAMLQLSQAFGSGVLRGEEFNALMEASPNLMRALAQSIGVPVGQLRAMAAEGKLTGDVLTKAFTDPKLIDSFREQAKQVSTLSGAWQTFKNRFVTYIGEMDQAIGASKYLSKLLNFTGEVLFPTQRSLSKSEQDSTNRKNLDFLSKQGALGVREKERIKKLAELRQQLGITGNQVGGASAITYGEKVAPNFTATVEAEDINKIHAAQDAQIAKQKELNALRDAAIAKQNAEEVRRINVAMWVNEQIYKQEKERIEAGQKLIEANQKLQEEADKESMEAAKRLIEFKQRAANENYDQALRQAKEEADKYNRIFERANDNLSRSLTDSIVRGFERGEKFIDNFKNAIKTAFRSYFVNIGVNFVQGALGQLVGGIGRSVLGAIGLGGSGAAMAGEGTGGILDQAKSLFDVVTKGFDGANAALQGSIESFGAFLANGQGGIFDAIGGAIGQYSSVISGALPFAGAALALLQGDTKGALFQGGGAALGTLVGGPVGGAIGSFIGSAVGGLFGGGDQPPRTVTQLPQVAEQFNAQLSALLGGFGLANDVTSEATYTGRGGGSGYGGLRTNINGEKDLRAIRYKDAYGDATLQQFIQTALTTYLVQSIQQTDLSQAIKDLFAGLTDNAQIQSMIQATIMLKDASKGLSDRFGLTTDTAAKLAKQSGLAGDELVNLVASLAQAAGAFKTPAQQLIQIRDKLTGDLGMALPATLDAFDAILKSFNTTTEAGRALFLTMFNLRDEFAQFTAGFDAIKKGVTDSVFSLLSPQQQLAQNQARLTEEFAKFNLAVPSSTQGLIAIGQGIDYTTEAGLNLALAFPTLVQAFNAVQDDTLAAATATNSLVESLRELANEAKRLSGATAGTGNLNELRKQFAMQSSMAGLGNTNAASLLPTIGRDLIEASAAFATSREAYLRDLAIVGSGATRAADVQDRGLGFTPVTTQAEQTTVAMDNLQAEVRDLKESLKDALWSIAKHTNKTAQTLEDWSDGDRLNVNVDQRTGENVRTIAA